MISKQKNIWTCTTIISLVLLVIAEVYSDRMIGSSASTDGQVRLVTGWLIVGAVATFAISLTAVFKTKRFSRIFAIFSCMVSFVVFGLAFFAYAFTGYGSY